MQLSSSLCEESDLDEYSGSESQINAAGSLR